MTKSPAKTAKQNPEAIKRKPPSLKVDDENNILKIEIDGDFDRISNVITSKSVALGLIGQIVSLGSWGKRLDENAANFAISFLDAMKPQDAAEALLFTQMAATHQAMMMMAQKLNHTSNLQQQDAAERAMNKLARTYAAQMEALKRYRSKGQQTVRVERVTVESGGQAVVGNMTHGGVMKSDAYPMHCAPRCAAKSKRSGLPCRSPAVRGWKVCRMHGAKGGAKPGPLHPNFLHGERSNESATVRALIGTLLREGREARQMLTDD